MRYVRTSELPLCAMGVSRQQEGKDLVLGHETGPRQSPMEALACSALVASSLHNSTSGVSVCCSVVWQALSPLCAFPLTVPIWSGNTLLV